MKPFARLTSVAVGVALLLASACQPSSPSVGSQTNWLKECQTSNECGEFECVCGVCTVPCQNDDQCADIGGATCVERGEAGAIALCSGEAPIAGLCLARCDDSGCPEGTACQAGTCSPLFEPTALVSIDPTAQHQTLIGFGASLAYDEDRIVAHPNKAALYDLMFGASGFDVIRIGNRFEGDNQAALSAAAEIVAAATDRMGRDPILFMTSGSPPAALKANGDRYCSNADPNCTLVRNLDGDFDYVAFAEHWRASLEAYAAAGMVPGFVSIQNNSDWIPPEETGVEACRFLPAEGTATVTAPNGEEIVAEFPGYSQALEAVESAISELISDYSLAAPEAGSAVMVGAYANSITATTSRAVAFHLYGMDPFSIAVDQFESVGQLSEVSGKPVIQSEMATDGFATALLTHYTLTLANGAAYLQQPFVGTNLDPSSPDLVGLDGDDFVTLPAYHALAHYARTTDPGWIRIDATSDSTNLLSSAWIAPDESLLTIVLVNPTEDTIDAELTLADSASSLLARAQVTRTVFDGIERSANLGQIPPNRTVRVPGRSIVTIATEND